MSKKEIVNPTFRDPRSINIFPVWNKTCEILLVGSMTAKDGMDKGFYYASARNQLWELLDYALGLSGDNSFTYLKNQLKENHEKYKLNTIDKEQFELNKQIVKSKVLEIVSGLK